MSEKAAPFGLSVTAADKFYDAIATSLDLPRFASVTRWQSLGREIAPSAYARGVLAGVVVFGIEATYILRDSTDEELIALQTRPQHEPASCEEDAYLMPVMKVSKDAARDLFPPAPLPGYGQRTPFDPFRDFQVSSDCAVESQPNAAFLGVRLDGCGEFRAPRSL